MIYIHNEVVAFSCYQDYDNVPLCPISHEYYETFVFFRFSSCFRRIHVNYSNHDTNSPKNEIKLIYTIAEHEKWPIFPQLTPISMFKI